jgi:hypothetical protein
MKRIAIIVLLAGTPALAQELPPETSRLDQLLRDLFADIEPRLRQFGDAIGNLGEYHAPEMLPNGDILIRRKTPLDPAEPPEALPREVPPQEPEDADPPQGPIDL